jgi:phosphopantetheinyl transferase (holo-ACP synthase)
VGNDVVDLCAPGARGKAGDRRFVERVFRPEEQRWIRDSACPDLLLWSLWAAKEAAYKIAVKLDGGTVFAHREFAVEVPEGTAWEAGGSGPVATVWFGARRAQVRRELGPGFVHVVATGETSARVGWRGRVAHLEHGGPGAESRAVRELAVTLLAEGGLPGATIARPAHPGPGSRPGPPVVLLEGAPITGVDVSLSHDGAFVAAAVASARR